MNQLSVAENRQLKAHEKVIAKGLKTFVEVGEALQAIRDGRLYRTQYATFEDYCQERWGLTRQHVNRTIAAAEVAKNLEPIGSKTPIAESQVRPLARLAPDQQRQVWQAAVETAPNGKVTATHVQKTVEVVKNNGHMAVHYSSATDEWGTPQNLFDILNDEFNFTLDVCALKHNAKCARYFAPETNGLKQSWNNDICWMNPPYGDVIGQWIKKAWETANSGGTVVCLLPARVDTAWWWDYCRYGEIRFLRGRLRFGGADNSAPFPSAIVIFRPNSDPVVKWWEGWRQ